MTDSAKSINYGPAVVLGLAMALGPLTALSLGTRYAGEETWERANAGLENAKPATPSDAYGVSGDSGAVPAYASNRSLTDLLAGSGVFDRFEQAVKAAGLDDRFAKSGDYTLFIPSDEAFARMPEAQREALMSDPEALAAMIDRHVVQGRYTIADLMKEREAHTMNGSTIDVGPSARYNGHIGVGGAELVQTNLFAANGVAHVIDRVIQ
jgi:uncharacterized surface protein with fasciclin (FAS1) repeats